MWIYRHHSCSDVIDLDEASGRWHPVADSERPRVGALSMVHRASYPICGSYTIEDDRRYCMYWVEGSRFSFMLPDGKVIDVCRKHPDGRFEFITPGLRCEISPARYADGRLRQGFSHVLFLDQSGRILHELSYDADHYLRLYGSDFTAASAVQDLSDWDFFVALRETIGYFAEQARSGRVELSFDTNHEAVIEGRRVHQDDLIYSETGKVCSRPGVWASVDDLRGIAVMKQGELLPDWNGMDTTWVWSRES